MLLKIHFLRTALAVLNIAIVSQGWLFADDSPRLRPNFVIIFTDDQGYQDLGCFGSPDIKTPNIDRMAAEGLKLTSFYAQAVCGPSRCALMTGSYPRRINGTGWLVAGEEIMIPEVLKQVGYRTGCIGKWDMSQRRDTEGLVPNDQGFDEYFGPLGANDGGKVRLWQNRKEVRETNDMGELTGLYTDKALEFIRSNQKEPFFLYLAHTMPHTQIGASEQFRGKSRRGLYGDVIEEIDWCTGRILDELRQLGLDKDTFVLFTSDNGPWLIKGPNGGCAQPLRSGKGSAWEGGFRVPCIVWGPGRVPAGKTSKALMATLDILPTFAALAGAPLPSDRTIDGRDQSQLIKGNAMNGTRETFLYYVGGNVQLGADGEWKRDNPWAATHANDNLHAVRKGKWKLALPNRIRFWEFAKDAEPVTKPELYDLEADVSERHNVADVHRDIVADLLQLAEQSRKELGDGDIPGTQSRSRGASAMKK